MNFLCIKTKLLYNEKKNGYVTLISVLVIGAVGVAITLSLILLGAGSSRTSFALQQSAQAKGLANACAEEALEQIREATSFTGSGNLTLGQGICSYTVTNTGGANRTVTTSGTVGTITRKVSITITAINPLIIVGSWQEGP